MVRVLLPVLLLLIAFWVYSIVDCALLSPTRHRGVSKPVWILIVVLLPVLGGILWFIVGRGRQRTAPVSTAPDDDLEFLGSIGSISDQDERIRRLEAELAALDAEDADPNRPGTPSSPASDDDGEGPSRGARG
ncbi:PLD nuclease N-terminal domain-containing protein [Microbacterium lacticum]